VGIWKKFRILAGLFLLEIKNKRFFFDYALRRRLLRKDGEIMMTVEELLCLEDQDIRGLKREDLDEAGDVKVDKTKSANQRMAEFLEKTKNPYAENVGEYILAVTYSKTSEETLEDKLIQLARRMTRIPM
jgi:hypothetical protein